jgi:hypothetical protein
MNDQMNSLLEVYTDDRQNFDLPSLKKSEYYDLSSFMDTVDARSTSLSLLNTNARSFLRNKHSFDILFELLESEGKFIFDIISLEETWLDDSQESLACLQGYEAIFKHKKPAKIGGGLAIFIKNDLNFKARYDIHFPEDKQDMFDCLFIEIMSDNASSKNVLFGVFYRSPKHSCLSQFNQCLLALLNDLTRENKHIILVGDFNINLLNFNENSKIRDFLDLHLSNNLVPQITVPTRVTDSSATLIDHIYTNLDNDKLTAGTLLTDITDHHCNFLLINKWKNDPNKEPKYITYRKFNESNIESLNNALSNTDWSSVLACSNPNVAYDLFIQTYLALFNIHLPLVTKRFNKYKHKLQSWMTKGILKSMKTKEKLYLASRKGSSAAKEKYKQFLSAYNKVIRNAKKLYWENKFESSAKNIKETWKNINQILNKKYKNNDLPSLFKHEDNPLTDSSDISNGFNNYFSTVGFNLAENIPHAVRTAKSYLQPVDLPNSFSLMPTDTTEVYNAIRKMKPKLSCGTDDISPKLLKQTGQSIVLPLTHIINLSFESGIFPNKLKIAKVIPIFKDGDPNIFKNYRPISLLPCFSKIIERLVHKRLYHYLEIKAILSPSQYGFQSQRSTEMAILELQDRIATALMDKCYCLGVFLDLSKAFDTLDHSVLLEKLQHYGVRGAALAWFKSYLSCRQQYCFVNGIPSQYANILCGVPQGSILGPLLFLVYLNDVFTVCKYANIISFADDTNLLFCHNNLLELSSLANEDLTEVSTWFAANKLSLNVSKSKSMLFKPNRSITDASNITVGIGAQKLDQIHVYKFLGVYLDDKLNWKSHITSKCNSIVKIVGILSRVKHYVPASVLRNIYSTLIVPHINYGITAWGNCKSAELKRMKLLQKKAIRIITGSKYISHTAPLFKRLNILTLDDIYKMSCCQFYLKCQKGLLPNFFINQLTLNEQIHSYETRQRYNLHIENSHSCYSAHKISHKIAREWNNLPDYLKQKTTVLPHTFTKNLKKYLLSQYQVICNTQNCFSCNHNN